MIDFIIGAILGTLIFSSVTILYAVLVSGCYKDDDF